MFLFKKLKNIYKSWKPVVAIILFVLGGISLALYWQVDQANITETAQGFYKTRGISNFETTFGTKDNPESISFRRDKSEINLHLPIKDPKWQKKKGKLVAKQGNITYRYSLLKNGTKEPQGIKEEIIMQAKPAQPTKDKGQLTAKEKRNNTEYGIQNTEYSLTFPINLKNLTPKKENDLWHFYNEKGKEQFYIPEPFMVDAQGNRSEDVKIEIKDNKIKIIPDRQWLNSAKRNYPVTIDPTLKLSVLDVHSNPQKGDNWKVDFRTEGGADLKIIPNDQATIDDLDFRSLECGDLKKDPQILEDDVIYYPNWSCDKTAEVNHKVNKAAEHELKFQFGSESAFAYNSPNSVVESFTDTTNVSTTSNVKIDTSAGEARLACDSFCSCPTDYGFSGTLGPDDDTVYCASSGLTWTPTLDLPADSNSATSVVWSNDCQGTLIGATSSTDGYSNTQTILGNCDDGGSNAAEKCDSLTYAGYSDWYLPAIDSINDESGGGLYHGCTECHSYKCGCWDDNAFTIEYWSSTEFASQTAWSVSFDSSAPGPNYEASDYLVRCVRGHEFSCGDLIAFDYNGETVTYGTVATSGECWMDRNLGATTTADYATDTSAYGDYFQWGRCDDGHQERGSNIYAGPATTSDCGGHPWDGKFASTASSTSSGTYDWVYPQDDSLWASTTHKNDPCPEGWRVPTESEWEPFVSAWSGPIDAANSVLALPAAGYRTYSGVFTGALYFGSGGGYYWSSTVDGTEARLLKSHSGWLESGVELGSYRRGSANSVRCLKDSN